nr:hypothetical protein [uncultured Bdellovibrio sp.]
MTTSDSTFKKTELALMGLLGLVAMTLVTVAVVPSLRTKIKEAVLIEDREIIAKANGNLSASGPRVTVLKIKNKSGLSLEVYSQEENGSLILMTKLPLFETRDGYFLLQGNATNLAITDVDKDGVLEIVAPTYDEQMVPRLNIFKFNPATKTFDRMTAPEGYSP